MTTTTDSNGIDIVRVKTWHQLEKALTFGAFREDLQRLRSPWVCRGLSRSSHPLMTTLQRQGGKFATVESYMLRQFKKYAAKEVVRSDTDWHWLSVAKHHDLPTRLLDWTNSPLVALHFATCNAQHLWSDGAVWMVNLREMCRLLPRRLKGALKRTNAIALTIDELAECAPSLDKLPSLSKKEFMLFFEPPALDERIVNQFALFSVLSSATTRPDVWLGQQRSSTGGAICRKVIVPARLKSEIRERLDGMNITERILFPGLDGLAAWMTRYYGPSTRVGNGVRLIGHGDHTELCVGKHKWEYIRRRGQLQEKPIQGITILAVTDDKRVVFVEQSRVPLGKSVIELPGGLVDHVSTGDDALVKAANEELSEETGFTCATIQSLARGATLPGLADEMNVLCLASGLRQTCNRADISEDNSGVKRHHCRHGRDDEGERIKAVYEVPLSGVLKWLAGQQKRRKVIDLRVFAGLMFANQLYPGCVERVQHLHDLATVSASRL